MLIQAEADSMLAVPKFFVDASVINFPPGTNETRELLDERKRLSFLFDLWRATIRLSKARYQTRVRKIVVLARLDIDGAPHTNPDGSVIRSTHLHLYREGYEDKWAYPLDPERFSDARNIGQLFVDFCALCNIRTPPAFQAGLL